MPKLSTTDTAIHEAAHELIVALNFFHLMSSTHQMLTQQRNALQQLADIVGTSIGTSKNDTTHEVPSVPFENLTFQGTKQQKKIIQHRYPMCHRQQ